MDWRLAAVLSGSFACYAAAEIVKVRASIALTNDQRNAVITMTSLRSAIRVISIMGIALWLLIPAAFGLVVTRLSAWILVPVALCLATWAHVSYFRRLRGLNLPTEYIRACYRARVMKYSGLVIVLGYAVYESAVHA